MRLFFIFTDSHVCSRARKTALSCVDFNPHQVLLQTKPTGTTHNENYGGRRGRGTNPSPSLGPFPPRSPRATWNPVGIMAAGAGTAGPASGPGVVRDPMASQPRKRPSREGGEGAQRSDTMAGGGGSSDSGGRAAGRRASRSGGRARRGRHEPGLGGAAERGAGETRLEEAVNRWVLKFYFHEALRAFRSSRYRDFRQIRDIMQGEGRPGPRRGGGSVGA